MAALPPVSQVVGPHAFTYEAFFKQADVRGSGRVGASQAVSFLKQSGLKQSVLSQIWDLADPGHRGYLDKQGFCVALKLIALVQNGKEANMVNIGQPVPLPNMGTSGVTSNSSAAWAILPEEKVKYDKIFDGLGPTNGLLPGSKVKPVLLNSKLAVELLGQIWKLSDMDNDGFLDREEFAVAMHLIYKSLEKVPLPETLPSDVVPPSKRSLRRCTSGSGFEVQSGVRQVARSGSLSGITGLPQRNQPQSGQWVVDAASKEKYNAMFLKADTDNDGFVSGAEIKDIFVKSRLPQATLAHIWGLCDYRSAGKLNRDQFALAMHLIGQTLKGVDPPPKLPPNMLTPLIRRRSLVDAMIPAGMTIDYSSAGVKDLDALGNELEQLRRRKLDAEQEKLKVEVESRTLSEEVSPLSTELESVTAAVRQIELQKREAQKRLDDLDRKKSKLDDTLSRNEETYLDGQKQLQELRAELVNEKERAVNADVEMKLKRDELKSLRQLEVELELKVESGHRQLLHYVKLLRGFNVQFNQLERNIETLNEALSNMRQTKQLYDALLNGELTMTQAEQTGSLVSPTAIDQSILSILSPVETTELTSAELEEIMSEISVPDNDLDNQLDEVGHDTTSDISTGTAKAQVPEELDWTREFGERKSARNDPFAVGLISELKSPINSDDPFGTGTFVVDDGNRLLFPGTKPPRPQSPSTQPKQSHNPPPRPKSPSNLPPRPISPNPPQRPKSPHNPPQRPKSPNLSDRPRSPCCRPERPHSPPQRPKSPAPPQRPSALPSKRGDSNGAPQRPPPPAKSPQHGRSRHDNGFSDDDV